MKFILITVSVVLAIYAAGLVLDWDLLIWTDNPNREKDAAGWLALSAAAFAASFHPVTDEIDRKYHR